MRASSSRVSSINRPPTVESPLTAVRMCASRAGLCASRVHACPQRLLPSGSLMPAIIAEPFSSDISLTVQSNQDNYASARAKLDLVSLPDCTHMWLRKHKTAGHMAVETRKLENLI